LRILIVALNYTPEVIGIGKYTGDLGAWLAARGHDLKVVAGPPYYPDWRRNSDYPSWRFTREVIAGAQVYRCPIYVPASPTGLKRVLHLASFGSSCLAVLILLGLTWRPEVILLVEPPLLAAPATLIAAGISKSAKWLHVQDLEVDAAFELGLLPRRGLEQLASAIERILLCRFDRVSSISQAMLHRLAEKGVDRARLSLLPNWVNPEEIKPLTQRSALRRRLGVGDDQTVALYAGSLGRKQGIEILIDVARVLNAHSEIRLVVCGDGPERQRLQQAADGISSMQFLPLQPVDQLNELLNLADIHLLPQRVEATDLVMPSKLAGMMASGRPSVVAASEGSELAEVARAAGIQVPPGDAEAMADAILRLAGDEDQRTRLGARARVYALAHWSGEAVLSSFEEELMNLSSDRDSGHVTSSGARLKG